MAMASCSSKLVHTIFSDNCVVFHSEWCFWWVWTLVLPLLRCCCYPCSWWFHGFSCGYHCSLTGERCGLGFIMWCLYLSSYVVDNSLQIAVRTLVLNLSEFWTVFQFQYSGTIRDCIVNSEFCSDHFSYLLSMSFSLLGIYPQYCFVGDIFFSL